MRLRHLTLFIVICFVFTKTVAQNPVAGLIKPAQLQAVVISEAIDGTDAEKVIIEATGGTLPYSFHWSNGQSGNIIEKLTPGQYEVTISDHDANQLITKIPVDTAITIKGTLGNSSMKVFLNTGSELIMIQSREMLRNSIQVELANAKKEVVAKKDFYQGTTICYIETDTLYNGTYFLTIIKEDGIRNSYKIILNR